nr:hypothetical protein [Rhodoferax sp.]
MKNIGIKTGRTLALLLAALLATAGAMAEKPDWAGGGKNGKPKQNEMQERRGESSQGKRDRMDRHFGDDQRTVVRNYYSEQYRVGRCPPGLAKKNNGCMPPGQARKWAVGQPLPRDVVYYNLPSSIVVQLGVPPSGHRYVRVASDILLIAIGTGMVIDGIENLGRR